MSKKAEKIYIERPEGLGLWVTRDDLVFNDEESLRETYGLLGARLRELTGHLGGRPRDQTKERCPCRAMTLARARARHHQCRATNRT